MIGYQQSKEKDYHEETMGFGQVNDSILYKNIKEFQEKSQVKHEVKIWFGMKNGNKIRV